MQYARQETGGKVIFIFKDPDAWLAAPPEKAEGIEAGISSHPEKILTFLSNVKKNSRTPAAEHLALYPVIKLTNRCNLNCSHCYIEAMNSMRKAKFDLNLDEVSGFLSYITKLGREMGNPTRTVQLFGGEPTLSGIFLDVIKMARDMNLLVRVSTNAASAKHFQSEAFTELYKDRGIEWRVSLESHLEEIHDQIRPNSYRHIVRNLHHMIDSGAFVSIKTVVGPHNVASFIDTLYFARSIGATQFLYSPLSMTGAATRMRLLNRVTTTSINQRVAGALEKDPKIGPFIQSSPLARYLKVIYTRNPGILPRIQYHINHDGKIAPQDNLYEIPEFHFGDIGMQDYDLDTLKTYQERLERPEACKQCPVDYYCPKGDYADLASREGGEATSTDAFSVCNEIRDNVYHLMSLGERGVKLTEYIFGK
ncbi:radical SAM/SPASM domain-containing protein [Ralstonia pseudosolanacearum]